MLPVALNEAPPVDFWPYFDAIPARDFGGFDCSAGAVENAYRDEAGRFLHVLVSSRDRNVFMALVIDVEHRRVVGHHLLNLRVLYGIDE
jgi:hypothetical protein